MKRICNVFVGLMCTACIISCLFGDVTVLASDILQDTEDLKEDLEEEYQSIQDIDQEIEEDGFIEDQEEDPEDTNQILSDTFYDLKSLKPGGNVKTVYVNTYDPSNTWLFDELFFKANFQDNNGNIQAVFFFPDGYFGDDQDTLINTFFSYLVDNNINSSVYNGASTATLNNGTWTLSTNTGTLNDGTNISYSFIFKLTSSSGNLKQRSLNYIKSYGLPSKNTYWEVPEVTPDPTPDPTPSVTPTPDPEQGEVYLENKPDMIVLIFGVGLVFGFLFGRVILGFIK